MRGAGALRSPLLAAAMLALLVAVLTFRFTGSEVARIGSWAAAASVIGVAAPAFGLREAWLAGVSALLTAALVQGYPAPLSVLAGAADQAAFLMAFIFLLTMVQEAARTSRDIAAFGAYLTRQPPGRRYASLFWGTNLMGVLFNLGAVNLLTPLVRKGLDARDLSPEVRAISEGRQISAILRGFAWNVIWSPTALAGLALLELIEGIDRRLWTGWGLAVTAVMFVAGLTEDRLIARRRLGRPSVVVAGPPFPRAACLGFLTVVAALFLGVWGVVALSGETIVAGLMLTCPALMAGWLFAQARGAPGPAVAAARDLVIARLPMIAPVAATLAFSGFLGRVAAALTPAADLAMGVGLYEAPDLALLSLLPLLLAALSFLGVSPIMLAVFFGSLFGALPEPPAGPTLIALSLSIGWSLAMLLSPYATVVMILAQQTGERGLFVAAGRNGLYALLCAALLWPVFAVLL
ncbi:MAG: hypothetical protein AAF360_11910 [Pseudomonadota bacterium]